MSKEKAYTLQIRIGPRTSASLRKWLDNQDNPNESSKLIIEHFTRLYGYGDIDSDEVQIGMAKDLLIAKGESIPGDLWVDSPRKHDNKAEIEDVVKEENEVESKGESESENESILEENEHETAENATELTDKKPGKTKDSLQVTGKRNINL